MRDIKIPIHLAVCVSITKSLTWLISSEVFIIDHWYLAYMILVTNASPLNWHNAVTLTFDLFQGQICCHISILGICLWCFYSDGKELAMLICILSLILGFFFLLCRKLEDVAQCTTQFNQSYYKCSACQVKHAIFQSAAWFLTLGVDVSPCRNASLSGIYHIILINF